MNFPAIFWSCLFFLLLSTQRTEAQTKYNNCEGVGNGGQCFKKCKSPSCNRAKCLDGECWTGNKYDALLKKENPDDYNNCDGKVTGDPCKKYCRSKSCKEAKCCNTKCLTRINYEKECGRATTRSPVTPEMPGTSGTPATQ